MARGIINGLNWTLSAEVGTHEKERREEACAQCHEGIHAISLHDEKNEYEYNR